MEGLIGAANGVFDGVTIVPTTKLARGGGVVEALGCKQTVANYPHRGQHNVRSQEDVRTDEVSLDEWHKFKAVLRRKVPLETSANYAGPCIEDIGLLINKMAALGTALNSISKPSSQGD